ncbi:MAG: pantoate--beta-alanine ligase [Bacteroidales bacterium]|nr:pantoate--beta-alanine ligase [Bacteroidales bacterium]
MADLPSVCATIAEMRAVVRAQRVAGKTIAFVPTMGALHRGHAALLHAAHQQADHVVASIFVNPTQFGPHEDFHRYPRTWEADLAVCADAGVGHIFAPSAEEMYPPGARTGVEVAKLQDQLEGLSRPGHFRGVCTIVLKLLNIVTPDTVFFGQKDAQQARIIRQMIHDLNLPVEMIVLPTVREPDGLALSSRNQYLSPAERAIAPQLYRCLADVQARYHEGERQTSALEAELRSELLDITGFRLDYAHVVEADTLMTVDCLHKPGLALAAITLGTTRLIDNVTLP